MELKKTCAKPGCEVAVSGLQLCCFAHWWEIPGEVRREIQVRLRGWKNLDAARERLAAHYRAKRSAAA